MKYEEFIRIFYKDFDSSYFYAFFLKEKIKVEKKRKEVERILKKEVGDNFFKFLLKNEIEHRDDIILFYNFFEKRMNMKYIYLLYKNKIIDFDELKEIKNIRNLKDIVFKKYKILLKREIDNIDFNNMMIFLRKYPKIFKKIEGNKCLRNIDLSSSGIKKNLEFFKILKIEGIKGDFDCSKNKELKSLKGSPKWIGVNFLCYDCGLEELGMEEVSIEGCFICFDNAGLKTLKCSPKWVGGVYDCRRCGLEELGMQEGVRIKYDFLCSFNRGLKTLKGCPSWVGEVFDCSDCGLEELGMQEGVKIGKDFNCSSNRKLKTLRGSPSWVGGNFNCSNCNLNEIDLDKGITIEGDLICLRGNNVMKEQVKRYIKENNIKLGGQIW